MENSNNDVRSFCLPPFFHISSKLEMHSVLYLQMIRVLGSSAGHRSGHPETLEHGVGSVTSDPLEIPTGDG